MRDNAYYSKALLILNAVGLTPVALSYGVVPSASMQWLFDIDASSVNMSHVFRAIAGLYLGFVCFWIIGVLNAGLRSAALWSLVIFMLGLGIGRLASIVIDGWPHLLLVLYMVLEFVMAALGLYLLRRQQD
jgi:hypothetical protein